MNVDNSAPIHPERHHIASGGDVVLVVGSEKTCLRVHSLCMRTASKAFNAMFGPHFQEGQSSTTANTKDVLMPDDPTAAMTIICKAIHHCNDTLPDVLSPTELLQLAVTADKYDCVLLKFVVRQWLDYEDPLSFGDLGDLGNIAIAAYLFDDSDAFRIFTQRLVLEYTGSYHLLANKEHGDMVPWLVYFRP